MVRKAKVTTTVKKGKTWYGGEEVEKMLEEEIAVRELEDKLPELMARIMMDHSAKLSKRHIDSKKAITDFLKAQGVMDIKGSSFDVENKVVTNLDTSDEAEKRLAESGGTDIRDLLSRLISE